MKSFNSCSYKNRHGAFRRKSTLICNMCFLVNAQGIASLVFQSISILCLIVVLIHIIITRILNPTISIQVCGLLLLDVILRTQKSFSRQEMKCFLSSSIWMFFIYLLLIFMFCAKICVGYLNYLHFVRLFPQTSSR